MSRTVSVNVDVDVDMRDIDTYNLVEELSKRYYRLSTEQRREVEPYLSNGYVPENLDHKMKFELFLKHIDDYFYTEFEERLTKSY